MFISQDFRPVFWAFLLLASGFGSAVEALEPDNPSLWQTWSSESFTLDSSESVQMQIDFGAIPCRRWKLVVDGGDFKCDLRVVRARGEELVYYKIAESLHEVSIPWGIDESVTVILTNRRNPAGFLVSMKGPPRDQATAAYSFHVNRALEAFAAGQRLEAEAECRLALRADPEDGVAKVLYAGFERDGNSYDSATALVNEALAGDLPPEMRTLAENMRAELVKLRAPLPAPVRQGLQQAEADIGNHEPAAALSICEKLLDGGLEMNGSAKSRILTIKGQALENLDRNFEAVDAYTQALNYDRSRDQQAVVYFHMGRLFYHMGNLGQAQGAFTIALQQRLPSGLDVQAREMLMDIEKQLSSDR